VLPDAADSDGVARGLVKNPVAREVTLGESSRHLDEQQDLADARGGQHDAFVDRDEGAPGVEVHDGCRHLGAVVGEISEGRERRREIIRRLSAEVLRLAGRARAFAALGSCLRFYHGLSTAVPSTKS
jgi:hypothetical protein